LVHVLGFSLTARGGAIRLVGVSIGLGGVAGFRVSQPPSTAGFAHAANAQPDINHSETEDSAARI
jgi:hypothetical protein